MWLGVNQPNPTKNPFTFNTPAKVRTNPLATPTDNTEATFNKNATDAFEMKISGPIRASSRKGAQPSMKGRHAMFMSTQTGAK